MIRSDTGILVNEDTKLHRMWFKQMTTMLGVKVQYHRPRPGVKTYNIHGELESQYFEPVDIMVIYDEHPNQKTMRKLGWNSELVDSNPVIHVPYEIKAGDAVFSVEAGGLFTLPAGIDGAEPRLFRVARMSNIAIYPASVSVEIAPVWADSSEKSTTVDFASSNFNLLADPDNEEN